MAIAFDVASLDRLDRIHRPLIHDTYLTEHGIATFSLTFRLTSEHITAAQLDTEAERDYAEGRGIETYRLTRLDITRSYQNQTCAAPIDSSSSSEADGSWINTCRAEYRRVVAEIRQSRNVEIVERLDAFDRISIRVDVSARTDALPTTVAALELFVRWILLLSTFQIAPKDEPKYFAIPFKSSRLWIFLDETTWRRAITSSFLDPAPEFSTRDIESCVAVDSKNNDDAAPRVFDVTDDSSPNNVNVDSRSVRRPVPLTRGLMTVDLEREEYSHFAANRASFARNAAIAHGVKLTPPLQQLTCEQQETFNSVRDIFDSDPTQGTADRRVVVDGVAGAGKTFMLSLLLKAYPQDGVIYLVKKRLFAQSIRARFANTASHLETYTVDAFLMRRLNIRSLDVWLELQRTGIAELKRCAAESCRRTRENFGCGGAQKNSRRRPVIFVDEFGQLEGTLTEILFELLRNERVVLVGDIYQQCAIGAPVDQPIRTLLAYDRVLFMYENVRARDPRLLERLSLFHRCTEDNVRASILNGLPNDATLSVAAFLRACSKHTSRSWRYLSADTIALLPRVMVLSNETANMVNWMIGNSLWVHAPHKQRLRYQRAIRVTRETELPAEIITDCGSAEQMEATVLDDPYADEHYVFVGLTYRLIRSVLAPHGMLEVGTRIVITAIESTEAVKAIEAPTDDSALLGTETTQQPLEFRVNKTLVQPYEYNSVWSRVVGGSARILMFPFVMDAASTVYQMQGVTLPARRFARCYIDAKGMDDRALYVALSRFETQDQIRGIINAMTSTT